MKPPSIADRRHAAFQRLKAIPGATFPVTRCSCGAPIAANLYECTGAPRHEVPAPTIRMYATWTSTKANLAEMHRCGVGLVVGPDQLDRYGKEQPPLRYFLDNGAWGCHERGQPFDGDSFRRALDLWGPGADFIVLPDVVAGGEASLDLSMSWLDECKPYSSTLLLPVQDGMTRRMVRCEMLDHPGLGLFIGGTTEWKERTALQWGAVFNEDRYSTHLHMGRVNTPRRIQIAIDAGCDSCDGTTLTRYSVNGPKVDRATRREPSPEPRLFAESA